MSFATRCTACGTIFKVVQDQLRVSDGWVRCGRCDAVFDAATGLFDLERQAPPEWRPSAPRPAGPAPIEAATGTLARPEDERPLAASMAAHGLHAQAATPRADDAAGPMPPPAAAGPAPFATFEPPPGRLVDSTETTGNTDRLQADEADEVIVVGEHPTSERPAVASRAGLDRADADLDALVGAGAEQGVATVAPDAPPDFLRAGRRRASWRSGRARAPLAALALLLLVALVLQAARQFSELAAARWPAWRPALTAWCAVSGCSVGPPHRIDDVVVESTALSPAPAASGLRLSVTLRNRAAYAVALPSIDLSLTDTSGKLIARRVLSPADFTAPVPAVASVPAGAELPLQTVLTADGVAAKVAGYTVEIFYP